MTAYFAHKILMKYIYIYMYVSGWHLSEFIHAPSLTLYLRQRLLRNIRLATPFELRYQQSLLKSLHFQWATHASIKLFLAKVFIFLYYCFLLSRDILCALDSCINANFNSHQAVVCSPPLDKWMPFRLIWHIIISACMIGENRGSAILPIMIG